MAIVSIGNGLYARTREGAPRRRSWSMAIQQRADQRALDAFIARDASGKFVKKTKEDKR